MEVRLNVTGAEWMQTGRGAGLLLYSTDAVKIRNLCDSLSAGRDYELKITESRKKRSLNANSYMWVLIDKLASVVGTDKESLYRGYVRDYGIFKDFPPMSKADADTLSTAWGRLGIGWFADTMYAPDYESIIVRVYYGSSVYTQKQMTRVLNHVIQDAKDMGIDTVTPEEQARMLSLWG